MMEAWNIKKTCPKCSSKAVKLYTHQTVDNKRKWVPIAWLCTECSFIYQVASDTLLFKSGELISQEMVSDTCKKCDKKLVKIYRHKNPKHGKQEWIPIGLYCSRCKYTWVQKNNDSDENK